MQNQHTQQTPSYYASNQSNLAPQNSNLNTSTNQQAVTEDQQNFLNAASSASLWNSQTNHPTEKRTIFEEQITENNGSTSDIYDIPAFLRRQTSDAN
jgi:hypothetical protein